MIKSKIVILAHLYDHSFAFWLKSLAWKTAFAKWFGVLEIKIVYLNCMQFLLQIFSFSGWPLRWKQSTTN